MKLLVTTQYFYEAAGNQTFTIRVYQDQTGFVGHALSSENKQITGEVRIDFVVEDFGNFDGIDLAISAVQGLVIQVIHANSKKPK